MSKFAPWTEAEAAVAAEKYSKSPTAELIDPAKYYAFIAALEWAAEQIEKCPSLYRNTSQFRELWDIRRNPYDTHEAKLVGVREVEK